MSAKKIQLSKNDVNLYPQTIDQAVAVVAKAKLLSTVLAELEAEDSRLESLISDAEDKISVLNGTGEGSVNKKIADAVDAFATQVTDDGTINTVKELFDYVAEHGSDFNALLGRVSANETNISVLQEKVSTLEKDNTTNKNNISSNAEAINSLNNKVGSSADKASAEGSLYARIEQVKADLAAMNGDGGSIKDQIDDAIKANNTSVVTPISERVNAIEFDYLTSKDKEALESSITAVANAASAAAAKGEQGISDAATALSKADDAYSLAENKIDFEEVGDTTYPDFNEIVTA